MFIILSPAKKLLNYTKPYTQNTSQPLLKDKTKELVQLMKAKSVSQIADLMDLSPELAQLNYDRYQQFHLNKCPNNECYPALFLFQGDVYQGLQAKEWSEADVDYSQSHLGILSGLYGLLRPMDRIQPYRLEMGVHLANPSGANLYSFWQETVTKTLNQQLTSQKNPVLINLASQEYFKAVDEKQLQYPVLTINFYEYKNNALKMIGIYAKKARGMMARYLIQNRIDEMEGIKGFTETGYHFDKESSSEWHYNFVRAHASCRTK